MTKIVIIGSGWGASSFLKHLYQDNKYDVTVISPNNYFLYTPLMIQSLFQNFSLKHSISNLYPIKHIPSKVENIDFQKQEIYLENSSITSVPYDYLILSHGTDTNTFNIPGVQQYCYQTNNLDNISKIKNQLQKESYGSKIVVIGTSLTGTELAGCLIDQHKFKISVIDISSRPLMSFENNISEQVLRLWKENYVNKYLGHKVTKIDSQKIYLNNNLEIPYNMAFWCGGTKNNNLTQKINKSLQYCDPKGIPITGSLEVMKTSKCYALGDCTSSVYPKTAQVAYQQGKYLAHQFNTNFDKKTPFIFYNKGQICYLGNGKSAYQNNYIHSGGKIIGYFNLFIHIYNAIDCQQSINFIQNYWKF